MTACAMLEALLCDETNFCTLPVLKEQVFPPLSATGAINLENAARLRYADRTGREVKLLPGGEPSRYFLLQMCEVCGERHGDEYRSGRRIIRVCYQCERAARRWELQASALGVRSLPLVRVVTDEQFRFAVIDATLTLHCRDHATSALHDKNFAFYQRVALDVLAQDIADATRDIAALRKR